MKKTIKEVSKTKMQTFQEAHPMSSLRKKLKKCDSEIQNYVFALEMKNLKLQKQIANLQAENVTLNNRIKILAKEQYRPKSILQIVGLNEGQPTKK